MSPVRASTKLATRARYAAIDEDAGEEDAASFVDADDRMPFGRASDFPPSYGEAKALKRVEGEASVSGGAVERGGGSRGGDAEGRTRI